MTQNGEVRRITRDEFLAAGPAKRRFTEVQIGPSLWRLRSLNDKEFQKLGAGESGEASVSIILLMTCDDNGDPMFSEADRELWHEQDSGLVEALAGACLDHLKAGDFEAAKND